MCTYICDVLFINKHIKTLSRHWPQTTITQKSRHTNTAPSPCLLLSPRPLANVGFSTIGISTFIRRRRRRTGTKRGEMPSKDADLIFSPSPLHAVTPLSHTERGEIGVPTTLYQSIAIYGDITNRALNCTTTRHSFCFSGESRRQRASRHPADHDQDGGGRGRKRRRRRDQRWWWGGGVGGGGQR